VERIMEVSVENLQAFINGQPQNIVKA